ncbi:cyclase family protein [Fodinicola feengrottensis]|uniref:Cyclase family protein n=1 Tax=Fodinicola feengrottensis TaxID=435914 RepID=A0ABN2FNI1_9ACTN|nr:cyclase family protein [Fodinicola feengrottensis]
MSVLRDFSAQLCSGGIRVVDLTAPLQSTTPILQLPPPFGNTVPFQLEEISRYDDRGPAWYWNNIHTGEHTGTHLDAPIHWVTGRDGRSVAEIPPGELIAPASVLDFADRALQDPDFLLQVNDVQVWESEHGTVHGWFLYRTGWDARSGDQDNFLNANETGPHTPGIAADCVAWLLAERSIVGIGVETAGTDAGAAHGFDPPFPCHGSLAGSGRYGLTQLQNLAELPPTGAVVIATGLPIVGGSGSPARVLGLVES